jgi:hypothetical protein
MMLAEREGKLATSVATEWVLDHLDRLDPAGEFLPVSAAQAPCGSPTASITRLPVMSGMDDDRPARRATLASVTPLWSTLDGD